MRFKNIRVIESDKLIKLIGFFRGKKLRGFAGLYFVIVIKEGLSNYLKDKLLNHERQHILDMKEMGYFTFVKWYFKFNRSVGYNSNPFELRAREADLGTKIPSVAKDKRINWK